MAHDRRPQTAWDCRHRRFSPDSGLDTAARDAAQIRGRWDKRVPKTREALPSVKGESRLKPFSYDVGNIKLHVNISSASVRYDGGD